MTELQAHILSVFKKVAEICESHNIPYYAIGGTMIGAVRHKGFIPWDDDIDIAVPIEHYEKLQTILRNELPPNLKVYTCDAIKHYDSVFMKVEDENTTHIENVNLEYKDSYKGVFVDIMPLSGLPNGDFWKRLFCAQIRLFEKMNYFRRFSTKLMRKRSTKMLSHILKYVVPYGFFTSCWLKLLKKYPLSSSQQTGYVWSSSVSRLIFSTSDFQDTVLLDFEDTKMRCPKGWHDYLTVQFGDYMKLPPEDQRVSGHAGIIDLEKSYHYYIKHGIGDIQQ